METKEEETASTSSSLLAEGTPGKWNARSKRLLKKKISLVYLLKVICSSQETCIEWLKSRNLIPKIMFCPNCNRKMRFEVQESSIDNYIWICKDCRIEPPRCSARHGSWMEKREAPLIDILLFTYLWTNGFSETQIAKETNMTTETVKNWHEEYSDICESVERKAMEEDEEDDERTFKVAGKDTPINTWRKKNKLKDPFLEFLTDADSL